ncbi:glycosyltransferase family 4 protein [Halomarina ordinaria]|uniref:Glycosyltransferase family 4 protein n=1 Tax=Halomarina ordinaria TaxID=3033939 RepID=A0ABD5UH35_9EURY|nr:glycosyltransferase family 4 protein [Halomarina sp. PSRA2]
MPNRTDSADAREPGCAGEEGDDVHPASERTPSVLVVTDFTRNLSKIERHVQPLAETADVTVVCITGDESLPGIDYRTVPSFGVRPLGLALMLVAALYEAWRGEYDAVASFSLLPHGCIALAVGTVFGLPTHLGIIGIDLDVHARAPRYGAAVRWLIRRFDAVSVPGTTFEDRLVGMGVPRERVEVLANPIDVDAYYPNPEVDPEYDLVWVGRFNEEKDPELFVAALAELRERGDEVDAVMLGDGPLERAVEARVRADGLEDSVELAGWVDDPLSYYWRSRAFVLTSERDALPLTLVEAMATGLGCVVPAVGNVPDVARDGETALVLDDLTPETLADALERLLRDDDLAARLGENAAAVADRYSYEAATEDWSRILETLGVR